MGPEVGRYVRAVYDFVAQQSGELSLQVGDIVKVTNVVDGSWLQGEAIYGAAGSFPSNFVEPLILPDARMGQRVFVALMDFPSEQNGDLELTKGWWCFGSAVSALFTHNGVELGGFLFIKQYMTEITLVEPGNPDFETQGQTEHSWF